MINKNPLIKFIIWCSILFLICIIGISNVFADEYIFDYNYTQIYYDNSGSSLSGVGQTWNESLQAYVSNSITTTANSYGAGVSFNSPIPIIANHTYTMSFYFLERSNIALSSKNHIAVGNSAYNAAISHYANSSYYATTQYSNISNGSILSFVFKPTTNGQWIFIPWTTTSTTSQTYVFQSLIIDDLGDSGVSQAEINTSLSNQNTIINNYITNSQNAITSNDNNNRDLIINSQEQTRDAIINNQNQNTQQQIESQKVCTNYNYNMSNIETDNGYLSSSGSIVDGGISFKHTNYIKIQENETYTLTTNFTNNNLSYCLYDSDKNLISCQRYNAQSFTITPSVNGFIRYSTRNNYEVNFTGKYCGNGNQELNESVNNLNDSLTSDNVDDSDIANYFDDFNDFLDENSTITQLITLPVTLYTAILNNLNGSCSPFNLGNLFGTDLILPCINIGQYLGSSLWTMIDIIISGFAIYEISKKFIKVFNNLSSLREGDVIDD